MKDIPEITQYIHPTALFSGPGLLTVQTAIMSPWSVQDYMYYILILHRGMATIHSITFVIAVRYIMMELVLKFVCIETFRPSYPAIDFFSINMLAHCWRRLHIHAENKVDPC